MRAATGIKPVEPVYDFPSRSTYDLESCSTLGGSKRVCGCAKMADRSVRLTPVMQSLWNDQEATTFGTDLLGQRVYTSRLLGRNPALVLHGGGNTSVKVEEKDFFGEPV